MQRDPIERGSFHHELVGGELVLENAMAKNSAGGRSDPSRNLTQRTSHRFHRTPLRALRAADDQERSSQTGWAAVFCPFSYSAVFTSVVAPQGGGLATASKLRSAGGVRSER